MLEWESEGPDDWFAGNARFHVYREGGKWYAADLEAIAGDVFESFAAAQVFCEERYRESEGP